MPILSRPKLSPLMHVVADLYTNCFRKHLNDEKIDFRHKFYDPQVKAGMAPGLVGGKYTINGEKATPEIIKNLKFSWLPMSSVPRGGGGQAATVSHPPKKVLFLCEGWVFIN